MTDLISRKAAIDGKIKIQLANGVEIYSDEAVPVKYLKRLPSAYPKNGKLVIEDGHVCCSECGEISKEYNYCPHCGARMDEV